MSCNDTAVDFINTEYLNTELNNYFTKSPGEIESDPYLRNFYAGIKPSSYQNMPPNLYKSNIDIYENNDYEIIYEAYQRPTRENKRLCPWEERKIPKFRNGNKKQKNKKKIKKYEEDNFDKIYDNFLFALTKLQDYDD